MSLFDKINIRYKEELIYIPKDGNTNKLSNDDLVGLRYHLEGLPENEAPILTDDLKKGMRDHLEVLPKKISPFESIWGDIKNKDWSSAKQWAKDYVNSNYGINIDNVFPRSGFNIQGLVGELSPLLMKSNPDIFGSDMSKILLNVASGGSLLSASNRMHMKDMVQGWFKKYLDPKVSDDPDWTKFAQDIYGSPWILPNNIIDEIISSSSNFTIGTNSISKSVENKADAIITAGVINKFLALNQLNWDSTDTNNFLRYFNLRDPYDELFDDNINTDKVNIESLKDSMHTKGMLPSYDDFRGFEIGTNHLWSIQLKPYSPTGRYTLVPDLPIIPLYRMNSSYYHDRRSRTLRYNEEGSPKYISDLEDNSPDLTITDSSNPNWIMDCKWLNYSLNPPILNYDLNFGSIKSESVRLFNGSSEVFGGMNYNITMNMSILDDADATFFKYMNRYINNLYDIKTQSMAPYWAGITQIDLLILRTGGNVKHRYKLLGVPIEFSPRFDGGQEANECRVDLTWGIIGMVPPNSTNKVDQLYGAKSGNNASKKFTWNDVTLKFGNNI